MSRSLLLITPAVVWVFSMAFILKPWRTGEFRRIVAHPPLGPWRAKRWWSERLLTYVDRARRLTVVVVIAVMSAAVAVGLPNALRHRTLDLWFADISVLLWGPFYFLFAWLFIDVSFYVRRITRQPGFESRSLMADCIVPGLCAAVTGPALTAMLFT